MLARNEHLPLACICSFDREIRTDTLLQSNLCLMPDKVTWWLLVQTRNEDGNGGGRKIKWNNKGGLEEDRDKGKWRNNMRQKIITWTGWKEYEERGGN